MLDIHMFRDNHKRVRADHDKRGIPHDKIDEVIKYDKLWLSLQHQTNQLRQQKNTAARGISAAKKAGDESKAQEGILPVMQINESLTNNSIVATERLSRPPYRFTEVSLVKK